MNLSDHKKRWGIVLAGGDGVRLRPLTRFICGDDRPKQFCPLYDGTTLLEQARRRAERNISPGQILFSLSRAHEDFYLRTLANCPSQRVVQPANRGTGAAILSSLILIARKDPHATIAVFPSDHHYSDENVISEAVENAFELSRREPDTVVLIGANPQGPEVEYGWIEVGGVVGNKNDSFRVRGFYEKPSPATALFLLDEGSLWNTFVMVGRATAFLEMICSARPGTLKAFHESPALVASNDEFQIPDSLYEHLPSLDFSREVLPVEVERLIVHRLRPVIWSDLGDCDRAVAALSTCRPEPGWAASWRMIKPVRAAGYRAAAVVA